MLKQIYFTANIIFGSILRNPQRCLDILTRIVHNPITIGMFNIEIDVYKLRVKIYGQKRWKCWQYQ